MAFGDIGLIVFWFGFYVKQICRKNYGQYHNRIPEFT